MLVYSPYFKEGEIFVNYFERLKQINEEIEILKEHRDFLVSEEENIVADSQEYVIRRNKFGKYMVRDIMAENVEIKVKADIVEIESEIVKLKGFRDKILDTIIKATNISVYDAFRLAEKFGMYLRLENVGEKTYLVPQDLCVAKSGINSIIEESELLEELREINTIEENNGQIIMKEPLKLIPYYERSKRTINGEVKTKISVNQSIPELASGVEVTYNGGLQIYKRSGDSIVFNENVLNLFPYDVLAFFDYYISRIFENPMLNVMEVYEEYRKQDAVIGLSYDDPAVEDIYRSKRGRK